MTDFKLPCDTCVHVLSLCLCLIQLVSNSVSREVNVTVYRCLINKVCQYLKLNYYAPKQSHYANLYLATIVLKLCQHNLPRPNQ